MKAWTIIWGIMAAVSLIAILTGATHHFLTFGASLAMCLAFRAESTEEDKDSHE